MKLVVSILFLLTILTNTFGQDNPSVNLKGVKPSSKSIQSKTGTTRAVIVGISDYQNDQIPDLQYAHKDAQAFKTYLQSEAGGKIPNENIQILTNADATMGKMVMALEWLMTESQANDKAIFYFSGHGDVEKKTAMQNGFLLTHDSPANVYMAGAFPIFYLQSIIATLSGNEVQTTVITDACRAGKLAGSAAGGAQITNSTLSQQFANEVKILSCQPNEFSVEGEQWGAGRGCFSYHLINGLKGLADSNKDGIVSLKEVERYLEDNVTAEVAPQEQNPFTIGNKMTALAQVNEEVLMALKEGTQFSTPQFAAVKGKGERELERLDAKYKNWVNQFKQHLEKGELLQPKKVCAEFYYNKIMAEERLQPYHTQMTRAYAATLIDEGQQYINKMLEGDSQLIDDFAYTRAKDVSLFPAYMNRAAELLTEQHYMYKYIKQKEYFFKGIALKNQLLTTNQSKRKQKKMSKLAFQAYQKALSYDSTAAYVHLALANRYAEQSNFKQSMGYIDKAIFYAPEWALAIATKGIILSKQGKNEKAIAHFKDALKKDATQVYIYQWLANVNQAIGASELSDHWNQQQIDEIENTKQDYPSYYNGLLAIAYSEIGAYEKADTLFKQVIKESNRKDAVLLQAQGVNFFKKKNYSLAKNTLAEVINLLPSASAWTLLAMIELQLLEEKKAKKALKKALKIDNNFALAHYTKGQLFVKQEQWQKAEQSYFKAFSLAPKNKDYWGQLLNFYESQKVNEEKLFEFYQKVLAGNENKSAIQKSFALAFQRMGYKKKAKILLMKALRTQKN